MLRLQEWWLTLVLVAPFIHMSRARGLTRTACEENLATSLIDFPLSRCPPRTDPIVSQSASPARFQASAAPRVVKIVSHRVLASGDGDFGDPRGDFLGDAGFASVLSATPNLNEILHIGRRRNPIKNFTRQARHLILRQSDEPIVAPDEVAQLLVGRRLTPSLTISMTFKANARRGMTVEFAAPTRLKRPWQARRGSAQAGSLRGGRTRDSRAARRISGLET